MCILVVVNEIQPEGTTYQPLKVYVYIHTSEVLVIRIVCIFIYF